MCEVVNPVHQQPPPTGTPLPLQVQPASSPPSPPQQIPLMFVMATGGNAGSGSLYSGNINNTGSGNHNCYGQFSNQNHGSVVPTSTTTQQQNCANITTTTMPLTNVTQGPMHTLITGHHPLAYCATPPPATTTIYTLHTIGASTNFIQLPMHQNLAQTTNVTSSTMSAQDSATPTIDYYVPSAPIPIPATPTYHIEVPAHTLRIELGPFKSAMELCAEPGDIIEIDRTLFSHWAIYIGAGEVVHIVGSETQEVPDGERAIVQRLPLIQVAGDCSCRVNNKTLRARERNFLPFHNEIVVRKALSKVCSTLNLFSSFCLFKFV